LNRFRCSSKDEWIKKISFVGIWKEVLIIMLNEIRVSQSTHPYCPSHMESREEEEEMQIKMGRRSKMVDCGNSYTPVATNYPEEGKSRDPKKHPWSSITHKK
jgi:hypothetical protein